MAQQKSEKKPIKSTCATTNTQTERRPKRRRVETNSAANNCTVDCTNVLDKCAALRSFHILFDGPVAETNPFAILCWEMAASHRQKQSKIHCSSRRVLRRHTHSITTNRINAGSENRQIFHPLKCHWINGVWPNCCAFDGHGIRAAKSENLKCLNCCWISCAICEFVCLLFVSLYKYKWSKCGNK